MAESEVTSLASDAQLDFDNDTLKGNTEGQQSGSLSWGGGGGGAGQVAPRRGRQNRGGDVPG